MQTAKSVPWLWLYLGCLRAGLVFHPLNEGYQPRELAWFIADAKPALVVCDPKDAFLFQELITSTSTRSSPTHVATLDAAGKGSAPAGWASAPESFPTVPRG